MIPAWHQDWLSERRSWFVHSENEIDRRRLRAASSGRKDRKTAKSRSIIGASQQATEKSALFFFRFGIAVGFHRCLDWLGFLRRRLYFTRCLHLNRLLLQLRTDLGIWSRRFDRLKVRGACLWGFLLPESRDRDLRLLQFRQLLLNILWILIRHRSNRFWREQIRLPFLQTRRLHKGQKSSRNRGIIVVAAALAGFVEKAIAGRARNRQIKVKVSAHPIRDLHILEHVLDRKMRLEVCSNDLRHLQVERAGITGVLLERIQK